MMAPAAAPAFWPTGMDNGYMFGGYEPQAANMGMSEEEVGWMADAMGGPSEDELAYMLETMAEHKAALAAGGPGLISPEEAAWLEAEISRIKMVQPPSEQVTGGSPVGDDHATEPRSDFANELAKASLVSLSITAAGPSVVQLRLARAVS